MQKLILMSSRAYLEPHIAIVHEGVRKKCEICNKVKQRLEKPSIKKKLKKCNKCYRRINVKRTQIF